MHSRLVVLGGGPAGYAAAFRAADLGVQTAIVEARPTLGGVCLLEGCIPSKALLHAVRGKAHADELAEWGIRYDAPRIDVDTMRARKDRCIAELTGGLDGLAAQRKVRVVRGRGRLEDPRTLRLEGGEHDGEAMTFETLIIATGSLSVLPAPLRVESGRLMTSQEALGLPEVPPTLLVVGGGYIGLELGTVYARLGSRVTVVEMLDRLLTGCDIDLVRPLQKRLRELFAEIRLGWKVEAVKEVAGGLEVTMAGPDGGVSERYDRVLVAVGRRPNCDNIGLETTGVQRDDSGFIVVDAARRTHEQHIWAIGDVAGQPLLAHKAFHEGCVAAEAVAGQAAAFAPRAIPAVVFTDPEIAWAGLSEEQAARQGVEVDVARYPWAASGRAHAIARTEGMTKLLFDRRSGRLVGAGIVGADAGELIGECVLAIEMGCNARDIAECIHTHPTLSETIGHAADVQLGLATEIYRPKKKQS